MAFNEQMREKILLPSGNYRLLLRKISGWTYGGKNKENPNAEETSWKFDFEIVAPAQYSSYECPPLFSPKGLRPGNKLDTILRALTGRVFNHGEVIEESMLVGKQVDAMISIAGKKTNPMEKQNVILDVLPVNSLVIQSNVVQQQQPPVQQPPVQQPSVQQPPVQQTPIQSQPINTGGTSNIKF